MSKNMRLYTTATGGQKTFGLMPVTDDCPFNEAIYMPSLEALAVLGKNTRDTFTMMERLDENGEPAATPVKTKDGNRLMKKQQRLQVSSPWEYFIHETDEIRDFVKTHAINADEFDWFKFTTKLETVEAPKIIVSE